jgi:hypothetical protein
MLSVIGNFQRDDKKYRTYKSALRYTQGKLCNECVIVAVDGWFIKIISIRFTLLFSQLLNETAYELRKNHKPNQ